VKGIGDSLLAGITVKMLKEDVKGREFTYNNEVNDLVDITII
jgi:hypothetical protein